MGGSTPSGLSDLCHDLFPANGCRGTTVATVGITGLGHGFGPTIHRVRGDPKCPALCHYRR